MGRTTILQKITDDILTGGRRTTAANTRDVLNEMANTYMSVIHDTASNFTASNPILETKQIGVVSDSLLSSPQYKIGDGINHWNDLPYSSGGAGIPSLQQVTDTGATSNNDIDFIGETDTFYKVRIGNDGTGSGDGNGSVQVYDDDNNSTIEIRGTNGFKVHDNAYSGASLFEVIRDNGVDTDKVVINASKSELTQGTASKLLRLNSSKEIVSSSYDDSALLPETAATIAAINHGTSAKTTLVDADEVTGQDSENSFSLIRTTWLDAWVYIKSKADTIYTTTSAVATQITTALANYVTLTGTQTLTNKTLTNAIVGTQAANDNSTKAASTAYVDLAIQAIDNSYFLERFTELPELAFSFDQLHKGALKCIEVERSTDNAKKDIGFRNKKLDIETLLNFIGSGSGYVRTFYSQIDNNHLIQYTYSLQPRIALSGVIDVDISTNQPMMYFDGDRLDLTTSISAAAPFSCFQTIKRFAGPAPMLSSSVTDAPFAIMEYNDGYYYSRSSTKTFISAGADTSVSKHCIAGIQQTTSAGSVYTGNTSIVGSNFSTGGVGNFISVGVRESVNAKGYISELIFYRSDQTANALAINADRTGNGAMVRLPSTAIDGALILEMGQSNIIDRATVSGNLPADLQTLQPHTFTFFKQSLATTNNGFWSKVKAGINTTSEGGAYGYYGIEPSLGARLKSVYGKSAYFIPVGVGGTGLDASITQPNWAATTGTLYARAILMFQQALSKSDKTLTPVVIWRHGNYDADNATWAANYQANEAALFSALRTDLGLPNLKIISVQLESDTTYPYKNTIRAAKIAVAAADANVILWNNPYALGADHQHDNPQSASFGGVQAKTLIGYDLADIISTLIP